MSYFELLKCTEVLEMSVSAEVLTGAIGPSSLSHSDFSFRTISSPTCQSRHEFSYVGKLVFVVFLTQDVSKKAEFLLLE